MNNWAPFIYGRTYHRNADFRTLFVPKDFEQSEIDWAKLFIRGIMVSPEQLEHGVRWSFFQNGTHRVAGATCMSRDVAGEMNEDYWERPTYVFLGYVARKPFPALPEMELENFKHLYTFVKTRWEDKLTSEINKVYKEEYSLDVKELATEEGKEKSFSSYGADFVRKKVKLIEPIGKEKDYWKEVSSWKNISFSLGLNFTLRKDAKESPFLISTCSEVKETISIPIIEKIPQSHQVSSDQSGKSERKESYVDENRNPASKKGKKDKTGNYSAYREEKVYDSNDNEYKNKQNPLSDFVNDGIIWSMEKLGYTGPEQNQGSENVSPKDHDSLTSQSPKRSWEHNNKSKNPLSTIRSNQPVSFPKPPAQEKKVFENARGNQGNQEKKEMVNSIDEKAEQDKNDQVKRKQYGAFGGPKAKKTDLRKQTENQTEGTDDKPLPSENKDTQ